MRILREYSGLSRKEFGNLFHSKESTVGEWENGRCVPMLFKLINISAYFSISLDCLVNGKATGKNMLEKILSQTAGAKEFARSHSAGQIINQFHSLPKHHKERLIGYLDALCRESQSSAQ